ncbi:MAG: EAL domain-containing protein [Campylobacterota bacterium]|nr:EAL domain-containing protein [Campylobacterota bacterium]
MKDLYLGRDPIIDANSTLCAYEILYKDNKQNNINSTRYTSASVISNILNKFGTQSLLGERRAFIKIDKTFLLDDLILSIPKEFFIFSILDSVVMDEDVTQRVKLLNSKGYKLSIDDTILNEELFKKYRSIFKELAYIKIFTHNVKENARELVEDIKKEDIKVVAINIHSLELYSSAKKLGCNWFQGYCFSKPKILDNFQYEPSQAKVLKLYNLLIGDTEIDKISSEFENAHEITLQLLQFINSGAFHFRNKISSIQHILTLVGRKPLAQWLMLMLYSKSASKRDEVTALMLLVKSRTELMEKVLKTIEPKASTELLGEAYFVGVLSLIEVVFSIELKHILEEMNVSETVEKALLHDEGILGDIYILIRDLESFNTQNIEIFKNKYNLADDTIEKILMQSMKDVNEFEKPSRV